MRPDSSTLLLCLHSPSFWAQFGWAEAQINSNKCSNSVSQKIKPRLHYEERPIDCVWRNTGFLKCDRRREINTISERSPAFSTIFHPLIYLRCVRMPWSVRSIKASIKSWLVYKCDLATLIYQVQCNVQTCTHCPVTYGGNPPATAQFVSVFAENKNSEKKMRKTPPMGRRRNVVSELLCTTWARFAPRRGSLFRSQSDDLQ